MSLRAAQVRIYVDADMLGLGKILASLRNDVTYPGDPGAVIHSRQGPPCPVTSPDVLDTDWIPEVAGRGWLIVTRDSMITQNRNEITAVRENKAKMVALNQRDAQTKWGQLEVFMTQWRRIEALISEPGPFIWRASRTAMTSTRSSRFSRMYVHVWTRPCRAAVLGQDQGRRAPRFRGNVPRNCVRGLRRAAWPRLTCGRE